MTLHSHLKCTTKFASLHKIRHIQGKFMWIKNHEQRENEWKHSQHRWGCKESNTFKCYKRNIHLIITHAVNKLFINGSLDRHVCVYLSCLRQLALLSRALDWGRFWCVWMCFSFYPFIKYTNTHTYSAFAYGHFCLTEHLYYDVFSKSFMHIRVV